MIAKNLDQPLISFALLVTGFQAKVFNVGNRRRITGLIRPPSINSDSTSISSSAPLGAALQLVPEPSTTSSPDESESNRNNINSTPSFITHPIPKTSQHDAKFFDASNAEAKQLRDHLAMDTLEELLDWLKRKGKVAVHDATNSTYERRY